MLTNITAQSLVQIGRSEKRHARLGMGGSFYGVHYGDARHEADILAGLDAAYAHGITHFDTASGYGDGASERLLGRWLAANGSLREQIFLTSKFSSDDVSAQTMIAAIDASRARLQTDVIDLYYVHWPRTGKDLRPLMEGLETARQQGKIRAIGVSNFSVAQMQQMSEAGKIDAHQLGYNLLWRFDEQDIIPYCTENQIAVVVYSALAHGILAGKYPRQLEFIPGDQRWTITLFRGDVWPAVHEAVEEFKRVADTAHRSLAHLAIRWLLQRPGVTSVLVSAKNAQQALDNAHSLDGQIEQAVFDQLTAISDRVMPQIPDEGNPFGYHP